MKKRFVIVNGKEYPAIHEGVFFREWKEVSEIPASEITHRDNDVKQLSGLLLKGYEMKFDKGRNANWEVYEKTAFDKFVQDYFVANNLNMTCDINHEGWHDWHSICGRVLYMEVNTVGLYFVVYVDKSYEQYNQLKWALEQGLLQGFSKEGYATDWEFVTNDKGEFEYELIKEISLLSVSIVSNPANGLNFEKEQEVKNGLMYVNKIINEEPQPQNTMDALFNV